MTGPICSDCGDPWQPGHVCIPGSVLREERIHAGVGIHRLSLHTRLNVQRIERDPFPSAEMRRRHREGVAALRRQP